MTLIQIRINVDETSPDGYMTLNYVAPMLMRQDFPADTWRLYNVASTSMQRHDFPAGTWRLYVALSTPTLMQRCINVMYPLVQHLR